MIALPISRRFFLAGLAAFGATPQPAAAAQNDESFFNAHKNEFNCYAYAAGDKSDPDEVITSIPGAAGGAPMKRITVYDLRAGLVKDGAIPIEAPASGGLPPKKAGYRLIAGFISPEDSGDFHFYRQEPDGLWTHKPAHTEVLHKDAAGKLINDPRTAKRDYRNTTINGYSWDLNYSQFAGFFYIPENGLKTGKAPRPEPQGSNTFMGSNLRFETTSP